MTNSSGTPAPTLSDIVVSVREYLQDELTPYRYSDEDLYEAFNDFVALVRRQRPDMFVGQFAASIKRYAPTDSADVFPFPVQFITSAKYYMTGTANLRDDQFVDDGRAVGMINRATAMLMTPGA